MIEIGTVVRPHGVRGAVKLRLHNPASTIATEVGPRALAVRLPDGAPGPQIQNITGDGAFLVLTLAGIGDRTAAEHLRGAAVLVCRDSLTLGADEYLHVDLIGCAVWEDEALLGEVIEVFDAGASAVLVIVQGASERLIPLADPWVTHVDPARRRIEVRGAEQWEPVP